MSLAKQLQERQKPKAEYHPPLIWQDPREDLNEDTKLWTRLMFLSIGNGELVSILNWMRCAGTRIVRGKSGYILRPLIDDRLGWRTQEEYEAARDKHLKPFGEKVKELLKQLSEEMISNA